MGGALIRQATPDHVALEWWAAETRGDRPERYDGFPECGLYMLRRVKGGPFLPVRIFLESVIDPETGELSEPEQMRAEVNGWPEDPVKIWLSCRAVSRAQYESLAERHRATREMSEERVAIDLSNLPITPSGVAHA